MKRGQEKYKNGVLYSVLLNRPYELGGYQGQDE